MHAAVEVYTMTTQMDHSQIQKVEPCNSIFAFQVWLLASIFITIFTSSGIVVRPRDFSGSAPCTFHQGEDPESMSSRRFDSETLLGSEKL